MECDRNHGCGRCKPHPKWDTFAHANRDCHRDSYGDGPANSFANTDSDGDGDGDRSSYALTYTDGDCHSYGYGSCHSYTNANTGSWFGGCLQFQ
jgi:hypothetical protein